MPLQNTWYINNTKYVCVRLQDASQFLIAKCCCSRFFHSLLSLLSSFFSPCLQNRSGYEEKETMTTTTTKYDAKRIVFVDKICCWRAISISISAPKRKPKNFFCRISFVIFVFLLLFARLENILHKFISSSHTNIRLFAACFVMCILIWPFYTFTCLFCRVFLHSRCAFFSSLFLFLHFFIVLSYDARSDFGEL